MEDRKMRLWWLCMYSVLLGHSISPGATKWIGSSPFFGRSSLAGINYVEGRFFFHTLGLSQGYSSADGLSWTSFLDTQMVGRASVNKVSYLNGRFYAYGQDHFLSSTDGMRWTRLEQPSKCRPYDITWGNGLFVGISRCSQYSTTTSRDGVEWTEPQNDSMGSYHRIAFGNDVFVAIGRRGEIGYSADGDEWTRVQGATQYDENWDVAFGNGMFIIQKDDFFDNSVILKSTNGIGWTKKKLPPGATGRQAILFAEGQFVLVGESGNNFTSKDGETWTPRNGYNYAPSVLAYGNGRYLAFGSGVTVSDDSAVTWKRYPEQEKSINALGFSGDRFIAVGTFGAITTSPDGFSWTDRISGTGRNLKGVAWGNQRAVAVGDTGTILTSTDLVQWKQTPGDPNLNFGKIVFGESVFVATTGDALYSSVDGIAWERTYSNAEDARIRHLAYGNGNFIALSYARPATLIRSSDGYSWTRAQFSDIRDNFDDFINYGPAGFVFGGDGNGDSVYLSATGETVQAVRVPLVDRSRGINYLSAMAFGHGYYVLSEFNSNRLLYSSDGKNWAVDSSGPYQATSICFGGGKLLFSGNGNMAVTSLFHPTPVRVHSQPGLPRHVGIPAWRRPGFPVFDATGKYLPQTRIPREGTSGPWAPQVAPGTYYTRPQ
jgi:hypothetical protein